MSLKYSKLLNSEVDWSDEEIAAGKKYLKWEELNIKWEDIDLTWDEIFILLEVENIIRGGGGYGSKEYIDGNPWKQLKQEIGEEKTKKVIKLKKWEVCFLASQTQLRGTRTESKFTFNIAVRRRDGYILCLFCISVYIFFFVLFFKIYS